jgi:hypothetical protein
MKDKNWERYHSTKNILLMAIEDHLDSIGNVNVYDNVSNQSDSYSLTNESMGTIEMKKLQERLSK